MHASTCDNVLFCGLTRLMKAKAADPLCWLQSQSGECAPLAMTLPAGPDCLGGRSGLHFPVSYAHRLHRIAMPFLLLRGLTFKYQRMKDERTFERFSGVFKHSGSSM